MSRRVTIPIQRAITYWLERDRWTHSDVELLSALVAERMPQPRDRVSSGDVIGWAYVLVTTDGDIVRLAEGNDHARALKAAPKFLKAAPEWLLPEEVLVRDYVLAGLGESPYVAFAGERGDPAKGQHMFVNLIVTTPGYIEVHRSAEVARIPTSGAHDSGPRRSPLPPPRICPTCHMALPVSGECPGCDD